MPLTAVETERRNEFRLRDAVAAGGDGVEEAPPNTEVGGVVASLPLPNHTPGRGGRFHSTTSNGGTEDQRPMATSWR